MRWITPIRWSCRLTASALSVLGSKFIAQFDSDGGLFLIHRIEWFLLRFGFPLRSDERLHGRHERSRHQQKVQVEDAQDVEQRVEAWHNFARLDRRYVRLWEA